LPPTCAAPLFFSAHDNFADAVRGGVSEWRKET
jgi:hypothetical protein